MKIIKTPLKGLLVLKGKRFADKRGYFRELMIEKLLKQKFIFNVASLSKKNVIRGLHFQEKKSQAKLISVVKGKIVDVAVDIRKKSSTFGKHFKVILSDKNCTSFYIPKGFAHGFGGLEKENIVVYSCTNYRQKKSERGIIWNDKDLKIRWGIKKPITSLKDKKNITFKQYKKKGNRA
tara:strand:+ start:267 stop:800 length:534 start_codon:yes stop_codon:yes gene_type:complete